MPVKWTPDNDQLLLLKILETHELNVDPKRISAAWPQDRGDVPTARAITERLVRIRQNARNNGTVRVAISSGQTNNPSGGEETRKGAPRPSTPSSARKAINANNQDSSPSIARGQKRKRQNDVKVEDSDEDDVTPIKKESLTNTAHGLTHIDGQRGVPQSAIHTVNIPNRAQYDGCFDDFEDIV